MGIFFREIIALLFLSAVEELEKGMKNKAASFFQILGGVRF